jgi:hypothetical protein
MRKKPFNKYFLYFILFILIIIFINFLELSLTVLSYPFDLDITEGFLMIPSIKLLKGESMYGNIHSPPYFFITKYPPVFYIFNAFNMILFGVNLFSARIISFLSSLIIGFLIYLIVKRSTRNKLLGILAFLFFYSSYVTIQIATQIRVDVLATLFSLLGIYFILDYKKTKKFYLAILFFLASFFTKQSFIAAPIASFVYLFMNDRKKSFQFFGIMILFTVSISLLINFLTNGQFLFHLLLGTSGIIEYSFLPFFINLIPNFIILTIGVLFFLQEKRNLIALYFIFSLIILLFLLTRTGAWINFLFEMTAIASITLFLFIGKMNRETGKILLCLFILFQIIIFVEKDPRNLLFIYQPKSYQPLINLGADEKILSYIKNVSDTVLAEHASYAILTNKEIPPELWSVIELERSNIVKNSEIMNFIKEKNYSMIIYYKSDRVPLIEGLQNYIKNNYKLVDEIPWIDQNFANETWKVYEKIL